MKPLELKLKVTEKLSALSIGLCFLLLTLLPSSLKADDLSIFDKRKEAQKVLNRLYLAYNNYAFKKPKLILTSTTEAGARFFNYHEPIIQLEEKAYDICKNMGSDFHNALAFMLGHELAHCFQTETNRLPNPTGFLIYDRNEETSISIEKNADVQAIFNAYVAGYHVKSVVPRLLDSLYNAYNLRGRLKNYPSLAERKVIAEEVMTEGQKLIDLFETAIYLSAVGKHNLAIESYKYIQQYYRGREIYNNLAISCINAALHIGDKDMDWYLYPLEIDWNSRIKKAKFDRGSKLESSIHEKRTNYFKAAKQHLDKAIEADPDYLPAFVNKICIANLLNEGIKIIEHEYFQLFEKLKLRRATRELKLAQLAYAIACANHSGYEGKARQIWENLKHDSDQAIAFQATFNLRILDEGKCSEGKDYRCEKPISDNGHFNIDLLNMKYEKGYQTLQGSISLHRNNNTAHRSVAFKNLDNHKYVATQLRRLKRSIPYIKKEIRSGENPLQIIPLSTGFLLVCESEKIIYRILDGHIVEYLVYLESRL